MATGELTMFGVKPTPAPAPTVAPTPAAAAAAVANGANANGAVTPTAAATATPPPTTGTPAPAPAAGAGAGAEPNNTATPAAAAAPVWAPSPVISAPKPKNTAEPAIKPGKVIPEEHRLDGVHSESDVWATIKYLFVTPYVDAVTKGVEPPTAPNGMVAYNLCQPNMAHAEAGPSSIGLAALEAFEQLLLDLLPGFEEVLKAQKDETSGDVALAAFLKLHERYTGLSKPLKMTFFAVDKNNAGGEHTKMPARVKELFKNIAMENYGPNIRDALYKTAKLSTKTPEQETLLKSALQTFVEAGKPDLFIAKLGTIRDAAALQTHLLNLYGDAHTAAIAAAAHAAEHPPQHAGAWGPNGGANQHHYQQFQQPLQHQPRAGSHMDHGGAGVRRPRPEYEEDRFGYDGGYGDGSYDDMEAARYNGRGNGGGRRDGPGGRGPAGRGPARNNRGRDDWGGGGGRQAQREATIPCQDCKAPNPTHAEFCFKCKAVVIPLQLREPEPAAATAPSDGKKADDAKSTMTMTVKAGSSAASAPAPSASSSATPAAAAVPAAAAPASSTWTCGACTFKNPGAFSNCNMCDAPKPR